MVVTLERASKKKGEGRSRLMAREELITSAEMSQEEGVIQEKEETVIKNLLRLNSVYIKDILTPRSVLMALPEDITIREAIEKHSPFAFSRIPIYADTIDDMAYLVLRYELLEASRQSHGEQKLKSIAHRLRVINEDLSVRVALDALIRCKEHLFVAKNEKGYVTGLVTLEDCIETLLGVEIVDEHDVVEDMRKLAA